MRKQLFTAFAATLLVSSAAHAQVVFDGGAPDNASGNEFTQWVQYEDFSLAGSTTVGGIRFWAGDEGSDTWLGSMFWSISANNGGVPGALLFSGTQAGTRVAAGSNSFGGAVYMHELAVNFLLGPGTYWLGLHNGALGSTNRADYYWITTAGGFGSTGLEDNAPFGDASYYNNGQEHAFLLVGEEGFESTVPEPATMTLLATGLAGMAAARRRRKA